MPPSLRLLYLTLRVADLPRSLAFYAGQLGFVPIGQSASHAQLATDDSSPALLHLIADSSAPPAPPDAAGLFHAALLLPTRAALGAWLRHAIQGEVKFDGFSDHGVSEALYLRDPDGNGLEFYCDRPRNAWPMANGRLAMRTDPLDLSGLLSTAAPASARPLTGARWGHLHLRVTNLEQSEAFYCDKLGLDLMQDSYAGARFLAADGYHHHLALNAWGHPRLPRPAGAIGLAEAIFARRGQAATVQLTDPDGIALRLVQ